MSIYSVISLKALTLPLAFLIMVTSLAGCSSSSLPPQSVSNTVWGFPNNTQYANVFLPDGRSLQVDGKELHWGKWRIEGNEIIVTSGYYTGRQWVNTKTGERKPDYQDNGGTYRFKGDALYRVIDDWFSPDSLYTKVDITAEKYIAEHINNGTFSPSPSP